MSVETPVIAGQYQYVASSERKQEPATPTWRVSGDGHEHESFLEDPDTAAEAFSMMYRVRNGAIVCVAHLGDRSRTESPIEYEVRRTGFSGSVLAVRRVLTPTG